MIIEMQNAETSYDGLCTSCKYCYEWFKQLQGGLTMIGKALMSYVQHIHQ